MNRIAQVLHQSDQVAKAWNSSLCLVMLSVSATFLHCGWHKSRQACSSQIQYLSESTKITTNTEMAMLSKKSWSHSVAPLLDGASNFEATTEPISQPISLGVVWATWLGDAHLSLSLKVRLADQVTPCSVSCWEFGLADQVTPCLASAHVCALWCRAVGYAQWARSGSELDNRKAQTQGPSTPYGTMYVYPTTGCPPSQN